MLIPLVYAPLLPLRECMHAYLSTRAPSSLHASCAQRLMAEGLCIAVRIGLNGRVAPKTRDGIFIGAVLTALFHAGYVMSGDSSMGAGN